MRYRADIQVIFEVGDLENPEMVAEVWTSGIVQGIKHNRPEVLAIEAVTHQLQDEVNLPPIRFGEETIEDKSQARPELESGE